MLQQIFAQLHGETLVHPFRVHGTLFNLQGPRLTARDHFELIVERANIGVCVAYRNREAGKDAGRDAGKEAGEERVEVVVAEKVGLQVQTMSGADQTGN